MRAIVRTSQALVEMPSCAAAASMAAFKRLGEAERDAARVLLAGAELDGVRRLVHDDDELRIASGESNFDASRVELAADLQGGLAEEVEQAEVERRRERLAQAASGLGGRLVSETGGRGEVLLDRLDVTSSCIVTVTMTSLSQSVKANLTAMRVRKRCAGRMNTAHCDVRSRRAARRRRG